MANKSPFKMSIKLGKICGDRLIQVRNKEILTLGLNRADRLIKVTKYSGLCQVTAKLMVTA